MTARSPAVRAATPSRTARSATAAPTGPGASSTGASIVIAASAASRARCDSAGIPLLLDQAEQRQHRAAGRRVEQVRGLLLADPQPTRLGHPPDVPTQHVLGLHRRGGGGIGPGVAVHERVERRIGQAEADVQVPPGAQIVHRVAGGGPDRLLREVGPEAVLGDRVEQAVLVAEQPVDRRRLDTGARGDRAGRHGVPATRGEQVRRGLDDARSRSGRYRGHGSNANKKLFPTVVPVLTSKR